MSEQQRMQPYTGYSCNQTAGEAVSTMSPSNYSWNTCYYTVTAVFAVLGWVAYSHTLPAAWLTLNLFGIEESSHLGASIAFFLHNTAKILLSLVALLYSIAWSHAELNTERVRDYLLGKRRWFGYFFVMLRQSLFLLHPWTAGIAFCRKSSPPLPQAETLFAVQ